MLIIHVIVFHSFETVYQPTVGHTYGATRCAALSESLHILASDFSYIQGVKD